jgi:hypothetical protein
MDSAVNCWGSAFLTEIVVEARSFVRNVGPIRRIPQDSYCLAVLFGPLTPQSCAVQPLAVQNAALAPPLDTNLSPFHPRPVPLSVFQLVPRRFHTEVLITFLVSPSEIRTQPIGALWYATCVPRYLISLFSGTCSLCFPVSLTSISMLSSYLLCLPSARFWRGFLTKILQAYFRSRST